MLVAGSLAALIVALRLTLAARAASGSAAATGGSTALAVAGVPRRLSGSASTRQTTAVSTRMWARKRRRTDPAFRKDLAIIRRVDGVACVRRDETKTLPPPQDHG